MIGAAWNPRRETAANATQQGARTSVSSTVRVPGPSPCGFGGSAGAAQLSVRVPGPRRTCSDRNSLFLWVPCSSLGPRTAAEQGSLSHIGKEGSFQVAACYL